ncbi:MAG: CDP-glycerol glycerophosphotransferase (TagB/SpsB family) [Flavobacteriales bacterium]|jgi:CDP-glycerol glycerophosphotransferase (TagB/SpsB family)
MQLQKSERRLVFYSEGKNYWVHLQGIIEYILEHSEVPVCYISSSADDPGLHLKHPRLRAYKVDKGFIRNYLFENIDTNVMVMTMPDLHQYQVKRSRHPVHYVYVQHSLVSLHMIYRKGAFDFYDTVFCSGPHHKHEIRRMEEIYQLPEKKLVEHGYGRLDAIIEAAKNAEQNKTKSRTQSSSSAHEPMHVLIAPSWGENCIIETMGEKLVDTLMAKNLRVTLRPHPQTIRLSKSRVDSIVNKYKDNPLFTYEANVAGQESLHDSDLMISDWSGAALDYAFGLNKPVIFIDVPRKVNNPDYTELNIEPFEADIRPKIGRIISPDDLDDLDDLNDLNDLNVDIEIDKTLARQLVFNISSSDAVGANYLIEMVNHVHTS